MSTKKREESQQRFYIGGWVHFDRDPYSGVVAGKPDGDKILVLCVDGIRRRFDMSELRGGGNRRG